MLTENQIDTIMMLSGAVWLGLVGGALTGALAGALICAIRTRRLLSFLPGSFCAILPAAAFAIAVSLLAALIQMLLCNPGHKSGWDVPVWGTSVQAIAIFSAGASGAFFAQRRS